MKTGTVVIKKYGNRRLYDTTSSRYINLDEIAAMVRDGREVLVLDAATGEDLTRVTLTQIIVEDVKGRPAGLPLELLRQLILASDQVRQEFLGWYLKSAFDSFEKVQSTLQQVGSAALAPVEAMKRFIQPQAEDGSELKELRQRVAELEGRLRKRGAPRQKQKRTRSSRPRSR
ncbi:MAG TPA: polyhydroxyalkanoate synthesis regulator DNA-binding domain-containing protein [Terriglobales bacterium]|nr:polyhydroxyalkanoate synthesis regulator DNA-binding domain-containing protein [Terriglobales bacterium]